MVHIIGLGAALGGIFLSSIVYWASIAQPAADGEQSSTRPYHNVEEYYTTTWWSEEEHGGNSKQDTVALVTGGNSGIGKGIAMGLCQAGVGTVIITSRSLQRGKLTTEELISNGHCKYGQVEAMEVELSDLESVRSLASDFRSKYDRLNYFVENAGGFIMPGTGYAGPYVTKEGYEMLYAGNYLGHFLLLQLLLDLMQTSQPARISLTSSISHWDATKDLASLLPATGSNARRSQENSGVKSALEQYSNTKLLQIAMAFELQNRLDADSHITITPVAPGCIKTNLPSGNRSDKTALLSFVPLALNIERGAATTLHALFSRDLEGKRGYFLQPYWSPLHQNPSVMGAAVLLWEILFQKATWGCHVWLPHPNAHNRQFQKQLWEQSLEAVGLALESIAK